MRAMHPASSSRKRGATAAANTLLSIFVVVAELKPFFAALIGGYEPFKPLHILITSSDHPINWWPKWYEKDDNNWAQVKRRIKVCYNIYQREQVPTETDLNDVNMWKTWRQTGSTNEPRDMIGALGEQMIRVLPEN